MKPFHLLFLASMFVMNNSVLAQEENSIPKTSSDISLSVGFGKDLFAGSLGWNRTHGLGSSHKFRLGYGLRVSSLSGTNLNYTTAPANLAADLTKVDTLLVAKANTIALNAVINIQYQLSKKLMVGFNIDAIGIGLGSETVSTLISSDTKAAGLPANPSVKPSSLNALLVGNNDLGQLKSELYAAYNVSSKLWVKGGLDLTFSEYTAAQKLTQDNDRFRYKANLIFLGISYQL